MSQTTKLITCQRSGVPLMEVTTLCSNGWALLSQPLLTTLVHPIYNTPLDKLLRKLTAQLLEAESNEWNVPGTAVSEMALSMSAIMYELGAMWQPNLDAIKSGRNIESSLPAPKVTIGCAARLLDIAGWYHHETSKRIKFPLWRPSRASGNINWHGFPAWLDACCELRDEWNSAKRKAEDPELLDSTERALATVHMATVFKRIDVNKVWNWIELQAKEHNAKYSSGRRETLKTLFMNGDMTPEDWMPDDCDDLIEMVTDCCDIGNDITHYIRNRVTNIRASINDFYGNFTIIGHASSDTSSGLDLSKKEQDAQDQLFNEYDNKIAQLTSLPPKPTAEQYTNKIMFLRAQAEWNILSRRFASRNIVPPKAPGASSNDSLAI